MFNLNPVVGITSLIIRIVINRTSLPYFFYHLSRSLFFVSINLIRNQGLIQTLSVLNAVNREINRRGTLNAIIENPRLNPIITSTIVSVLNGHWNNCLKFADIINRNYFYYIFGIILSSSGSLLWTTSKFDIGLVFSSIGIVFSETLSSISYFKDSAYSILQFIEKYTDLQFLPKTIIKENYEVITEEKYIPKHNVNAYEIIGSVLLGLLGFTICLVVAHKYAHDIIHNIPVIGTYTDFIVQSYTNLFNWLTGKNTYIPDPSPQNSPNPSPILLPQVEPDLTPRPYRPINLPRSFDRNPFASNSTSPNTSTPNSPVLSPSMGTDSQSIIPEPYDFNN